MAKNDFNRRIGARADVRVPVRLQRDAKAGLLRRTPHVEAIIVNASVSGLEVECHPLPHVAVRDRLIVQADKGTAVAQLRRIETIDQDRVHYGLMLLESDRAFESAVYPITTALHAESVDWVWETAR